MNISYKAAFVDLSCNFYDKHQIYSIGNYLMSKGIEAYYINERSFSKAVRKVKLLNPDVLLYSAFSVDIPAYIRFDGFIKKSINIKSIIGGNGPTFDQSFLEHSTIDALCIGEGEYALADYILNGFSGGGRNIILNGEKPYGEYYKLVDLDSLSFPDRDIVYEQDKVLRSMSSKQFLSGRGCPYRCTYCFNHSFNKMFQDSGPVVRKKSVDNLIAEIQYINKKYPFQNAAFQDDTFILRKKWLFEFFERFPKEVGLTYTCNIRANLVSDEIIMGLKESGCIGVSWSIESGNDFIRNEILKRNMKREDIIQTGRLLKKYKISYRVGNLVGLPGETYEQMLDTLELSQAINPGNNMIMAHVLVPFPSLDLTEYALEKGHLSAQALKDLPRNYSKSIINFTNDEKKRIQKLRCLFPILARYPFLYKNKSLYNCFYIFPTFFLRLIYEGLYVYKLATYIKLQAPLRTKILMFGRYIRNLFAI